MGLFGKLGGGETPEARKAREKEELRKKNEEYLNSQEYRDRMEKFKKFAEDHYVAKVDGNIVIRK